MLTRIRAWWAHRRGNWHSHESIVGGLGLALGGAAAGLLCLGDLQLYLIVVASAAAVRGALKFWRADNWGGLVRLALRTIASCTIAAFLAGLVLRWLLQHALHLGPPFSPGLTVAVFVTCALLGTGAGVWWMVDELTGRRLARVSRTNERIDALAQARERLKIANCQHVWKTYLMANGEIRCCTRCGCRGGSSVPSR